MVAKCGTAGTSSWSSRWSFTTFYPQDVTFQNQTVSTPQEDVKAHGTITLLSDQFSSGGSISFKAGATVNIGNNVTVSNGSAVNFVVDPGLQ